MHPPFATMHSLHTTNSLTWSAHKARNCSRRIQTCQVGHWESVTESADTLKHLETLWNMSKPAQIHANYIEFSFHCYTQSFKFCHDSRAKQLVMSHVQNQTWDCLQMLQAKHSWSMLVATSSVCEVAFKCMWATFWKFPAFKCISSWEQRYSVLKKDIQNRTKRQIMKIYENDLLAFLPGIKAPVILRQHHGSAP